MSPSRFLSATSAVRSQCLQLCLISQFIPNRVPFALHFKNPFVSFAIVLADPIAVKEKRTLSHAVRLLYQTNRCIAANVRQADALME